MSAQAWKIYGKAKKAIGNGGLTLHTGVFKLSLHRNSASATITSLSTMSKFSSVGSEISAYGTYAAGGRTIPAWGWTAGRSATEWKTRFTTAGVVFTASGSNLINIRYALIHKSVGSATSGQPLCYCSLSSAQFTIASPNTLTILPHASGVFYLV